MRWLVAITLCIVAMIAYEQEEAAEKLFRSMETKVRDAKSLKLACEVHGRIAAGGEEVKLKAVQQFAGVDRARFELRSKELDLLFVCDGKHMVQGDAGRFQEPRPADPKLNEGVCGAIARGGFMLPRLVKQREAGSFNADKTLLISGFKLGAKERIGAVEAQGVEYSVRFGGLAIGPGENVKVTVWIDPKTLVPLKRKVVVGDGEADFFTEVYTKFVIDPKLDAKVFELPK